MATRYTKTKVINSDPFGSTKGQKAILVALCILALGVIGASIKATLSFIGESKTSEITTTVSYGEIDELLKPSHFIEQYLSVNCDETAMRNIQSIRMVGKIADETLSQQFSLTKKQPELMRVRITHEQTEMTIGVTDGQVWQRLRKPYQQDQVSELSGDEATQWLNQSRFYDPIISAHLNKGRIESIESAQYEARTYLKATVLSATGTRIQVLVDPATMYPYAEITKQGDSVRTVLMSDFRTINGMPTPFQLETFVNGIFVHKVMITTAAINIGVLSDYFIRPQELTAQ